MSYPAFPIIQKPAYPVEEVYPDNKIESAMDGGYTVTRPRNSRSQMGNNYSWPAMPDIDYQVFKTFAKANDANIFVWTDPVTGTTYNAQFVGAPKASLTAPGFWQVSISIREA